MVIIEIKDSLKYALCSPQKNLIEKGSHKGDEQITNNYFQLDNLKFVETATVLNAI